MNWFQTLLFGKVIKQLEDKIMSTRQEVLQAIEDERIEVQGRIDTLEARIQELEDQVANGEPVTPEQFAELKAMVQGIHTPPSEQPV